MSYKSVKYVTDLLKKNGFVFKSQKGQPHEIREKRQDSGCA